MTTIQTRVAADGDDCIRYGASIEYTGTRLYVGNDSGYCDNGLRFMLAVPADATIVEATLTLTAYDNESADTVRVTIAYQDANNPPDFSGDSAGEFDARVRSAATVGLITTADWTADVEYEIDITTLIQALVNEAYWASGEYCVIFIDDNGSDANAHRTAYQYAGSAEKAALLTVTYEKVYMIAVANNRWWYMELPSVS